METSRKQRRTSIVRNTSKPIMPSSPPSRTSSTSMDTPLFVPILEALQMKACKEHHDEELDANCNLYHSDFDKEQNIVQLQLLGASYDVVPADGAMNIFHVK